MKRVVIILFILAYPFLGRAEISWQNNKNITKPEIDNIHSLSVLYGKVRYFYPNDKVLKMDWLKFLIFALRETSQISNSTDFANKVQSLFSPIVPGIKVSNVPLTHLNGSSNHIPYFCWEHQGFGNRPIENIFKSSIVSFNSIRNDIPKPDSICEFKLSDHLWAYFPLAVSHSAKSSSKLRALTHKVNKVKLKLLTKNIFKVMSGKEEKHLAFVYDINYRIADAIIRWNMICHFYPYYQEDSLHVKWDEALIQSINDMALCRDEYEYKVAIMRLMGHVNDSHIWFNNNAHLGGIFAVNLPEYHPRIGVGFIDGKAYISRFQDSLKMKLSIGDLIQSVNNIPIDSLIKRKMQFISSSTLAGKYLCLENELLSISGFRKDTVLNLVVQNQRGDTVHLAFRPYQDHPYSPKKHNPYFFQKIDSGIYYINPTHRGSDVSLQNFKLHVPELQRAKGIILDIRGYPHSIMDSIITYFKKDSIRWGVFGVPVYRFPCQENVIYKTSKDYLPPAKSYISTPVVVLTDERAISYAETIIEIIKRNKIATLIGSNTNGTNGDVTSITLPVYGFNMTCVKDLSGYHGKGISPDIYIRPTLDDIRNNRDVVLEKAKTYLNGL